MLTMVLTMHFLWLKGRDDPDQTGLHQWHRWIMSSMSFSQKLDAVVGICKDGFETEGYQTSGFADLLPAVRAMNTRRNQLAHSGTTISYDFDAPGAEDWMKASVFEFSTKRAKGLLWERIDVAELRSEVEAVRLLASELSDRHLKAWLPEASEEPGERPAEVGRRAQGESARGKGRAG
jgi:hypothetical protein